MTPAALTPRATNAAVCQKSIPAFFRLVGAPASWVSNTLIGRELDSAFQKVNRETPLNDALKTALPCSQAKCTCAKLRKVSLFVLELKCTKKGGGGGPIYVSMEPKISGSSPTCAYAEAKME